ncbi:hypothetical protein NDU88_003758 [Pleurodeles waltl]|uniref:DDE Tnp4 domain-containing protein n=1 Tax=Pleurodeles waltl TaxID=8319 RepID=A0AAV7KVT4_PLEWA|nr:hypothetical protein NDU88_003758 [Pleurodeles waltl]
MRIITAGAPVHWLLGPIGSNVNQCSIAPRSTTAYRKGVQRQRSYPTIPLSQFRVHDAYILRNSSIPDMMGQLQRHRVWLLGDSGYPNLSWLLTPVRNPRTRAEERYNDAHGRTRRVIERTFGLLKARFRCLHMTGGSLFYSPKKVCDIIIACSMLHNLALRRQVPFLQDDPDDSVVAAVEPVERVDSDEDEAEDEENDNRESVIQLYFQ